MNFKLKYIVAKLFPEMNKFFGNNKYFFENKSERLKLNNLNTIIM